MENNEIQTDLLIIGAGPVGLFTVFEAGLLKMRCHLIDVLPQVGGQLTEIYPKKPIYDIPGFPSVLAQDLISNLMDQIEPFKPGFTLGEEAVRLEDDGAGQFVVTTDMGTIHRAPAVAIAGGLGKFEPRKPPIANIAQYEKNGVIYMIKDPEQFRNKSVVLAGGGDSALDWAIHLADIASDVHLVHRRSSFRGAPDSVESVKALAEEGKITLVTEAQITEIKGDDRLEAVLLKHKDNATSWLHTDYFIPLFGLAPKLDTFNGWGLELDKHAIAVDTFDYQTNRPGVYAIGDINTYPGKLKLILCGFHEATLMCQSAFKRVYPDKKLSFKYTTVSGVNEF